jgi:predicted Zn-dependent protease
VGESHAQRVGYSILKNLNLDELIATSGENYVTKGVQLAKDKEALRELKSVIRSRLLASSICNPKVITREMELHYRRIWTEYLAMGAAEWKPAEQSAESGVSMKSAITAVGRVRMAMVKLEAGRFEEAIEICSKLVDSSETSPLAQYVLGVALHRLGRDIEAIEALEMSLMQRQDNPGAWKLLGELYLVQNDVGKANICLEKIATIQKQSQCLDAYTL